MDSATEYLPLLLGTAVVLPLISFWVILILGPKMGKAGKGAGALATGAICFAFGLSAFAMVIWLSNHWGAPAGHGEDEHAAVVAPAGEPGVPITFASFAADQPAHGEHNADHGAHHDGHGNDHDAHDGHGGTGDGHAVVVPVAYSGDWYTLGVFGELRLSIGYYIDALTICMFCMVTFIASCIHFYALGYMHEELEDVTDHEVTLSDGSHLTRPGRFHRFFQYMSLFCFSMLGLVVAGNVAMTFVFWELVGICSYFLIGFYVERKSASTAGNKAFIVNRIGDFGMIIGLMALWSSLGTFNYGDFDTNGDGTDEAGVFSLVRPEANDYRLMVPDGMIRSSASALIAERVRSAEPGSDMRAVEAALPAQIETLRVEAAEGDGPNYGYWLLVVAGVGIFCGCVGKSAQFPLHTWLPDAMEGPTPVSALVHSATMVAAGVYLVARFFPVFAPEVLLVIAVTGCVTLFLAATIAVTATDIKRVLAYSTVSQLGYMMLALGVGGWLAGVLHLFTHAFFKSLLFMCSGSVIHATHTNEMPRMGGLLKKMPWTGFTMLVGCLAIAGAGIPFVIGFSGYYSKDAILEQALLFGNMNPTFGKVFFYAAASGAAITAFYMFRLWYMTFLGKPRDEHVYEHAHESPKVMYVPLVVLAVLAVCVAWPLPGVNLAGLLESARPAGTLAETSGAMVELVWPNEHDSHAWPIKWAATWTAFFTALFGFALATLFYGVRALDPEETRRSFAPIHRFLLNKWWFDELYDAVFVRPALWIAGIIAWFDKRIIDGFIDGLAWAARRVSTFWAWLADTIIVDGLVDWTAKKTYETGLMLRGVQTGRLRQYVLLIAVGTVILFVVVSFFVRFLAPAIVAGA